MLSGQNKLLEPTTATGATGKSTYFISFFKKTKQLSGFQVMGFHSLNVNVSFYKSKTLQKSFVFFRRHSDLLSRRAFQEKLG